MPELTYQKVAKDALKLSLKARARLASELLASLEPSAEREIDRLWMDEARRRDREMDSGHVGVPLEQALRKVRAAIK